MRLGAPQLPRRRESVLRLPPDLAERIAKMAKRRKVSKNFLYESAIKEFLDREDP